jgi:hypothetical protein
MQINSDDARIVLSAIHIANFETGEDCCDECESDTKKLVARIRSAFPEIDKEIRQQQRRSYIWGVLTEQDERVIKARKELDGGFSKNKNFERDVMKFSKLKAKVARELEKTVPQEV